MAGALVPTGEMVGGGEGGGGQSTDRADWRVCGKESWLSVEALTSNHEINLYTLNPKHSPQSPKKAPLLVLGYPLSLSVLFSAFFCSV